MMLRAGALPTAAVAQVRDTIQTVMALAQPLVLNQQTWHFFWKKKAYQCIGLAQQQGLPNWGPGPLGVIQRVTQITKKIKYH